MTALAIVVAGPDPARARTALDLAAAAAALGRPVAILFDGPSVELLPALAEALATALDLGVEVTACTTGLALSETLLPQGVTPGGMVSFLQANPGANLTVV